MNCALILTRWLHFTTEMVLFGTLLFPLYSGIEGSSRHVVRESPRLPTILAAAGMLVLLTATAWLALEAGEMGDGPADMVNPAAILAVLTGTTFGHVWQVHLALAVVLAAVVAKAPLGGRRHGAALVLVALLLASQAWVGHAVMERGAVRAVHIMSQIIHLAAGGMWLGGLVPLGYTLRRANGKDADQWSGLSIHAVQRFSMIGLAAVVMLLASGLVNSWFLVGSWRALATTLYGRVLLAKLCLFLIMLGIAAYNRLALLPQLDSDLDRRHSLSALYRAVTAEQVFGVAILGISSILGTLSPAIHGP